MAVPLDYDNDGWLDLMFINGHIYPIADKEDWGSSYAQRVLLFRNLRNGNFEEVPPVTGSGLAALTSGRGAAFGDLFNNGKIDVVISPIDGPLLLLKNVNPDHNHWVEMKLVGGPKSPRDAVGATVYLTADGMRQRQDVLSGGSYASSNDQRPHFGSGRRDRCWNGGDPLAFGSKRDDQAAGRRSHLHRRGREGNYGRSVRRAKLPGCGAPNRCHSACRAGEAMNAMGRVRCGIVRTGAGIGFACPAQTPRPPHIRCPCRE